MFDRLRHRRSEEEFKPDPFLHDTGRPLTEGRGELRIEGTATRVDFLRLAGFALAGAAVDKLARRTAEPGSDA